jgi:outer membrane protein OmpA-like peptidoglycan-associated protein/uncharacterized protein YidB (DUF937 family)
MGIFDYLIREVDQEFNLANKARPLLSALLGEINDETAGGLTGFLDKFKNAGLTNLVNSWISSGDPAPLAEGQLQNAVGDSWINRLGSLVGLPAAVAGPALAYMIPKVISALTPDGILPRFLPESVREYLAGFTVPAGASKVSIVEAPLEDSEPVGLRNPLGLLGLAALLASALWALFAPKPEPPVVNTTPLPRAGTLVVPDFTAAINASREKTLQALQALKPGAYKPEDVITIINGLIIHFDTASDIVKPEYDNVLKKSAEVIKALPAGSTPIEIGGHTDSDGDDASNLDLSQRRAAAVMKKLVDFGVAPQALQAKGYGETVPKADNSTEQGKFENRRIEYKIIVIK